MRVSREAAILFIVCAVYSAIGFGIYSGWAGLPSPIYGGDYYYQLGQINRMYETSPPEWFGSSNGLGERPGYFPVYGILVTVFGKILALAPMQAMLYFNIMVPYLSVFAFFFLARELFNDERVAAVLALLLFPGSIVMKYTSFTPLVVVPLFLLFLLRFYKEQKMETALPLGVLYGVLGLSHSSGFPIATALFLAISAYLLWKKRKGGEEISAGMMAPFAAAFALGLLISLIYWWEPLFVYHLQTNLQSEVWSLHDLRMQDVAFSTASDIFMNMFLDFSRPREMLETLLLLAGIGLAVTEKKWKENTFLILSFAVLLAINFSFLVTAPLFDIQFIPGYIFGMYTSVAAVLVGGIALKAFAERKPEWWKYTYFILLAALVFFAYESFVSIEDSQYFPVAEEGLAQVKMEFAAWAKENTDVHDTILSTNELSFAINALTGRELLVSRRAQNDAYMDDFDDRQLAAAVIFYGNDPEEKKRLLREYGIDYIYVDYYWEESEYMANGDSITPFDPLLVLDTPEHREVLDKNGVKYVARRGWLDPSVIGTSVRSYELLYVDWENYDYYGKGPWKTNLDPYLRQVWVYEDQGYTLAALYKVNLR